MQQTLSKKLTAGIAAYAAATFPISAIVHVTATAEPAAGIASAAGITVAATNTDTAGATAAACVAAGNQV